MKKISSLENWDEVSLALRDLAENESMIRRLENKMNEKISAIKDEYSSAGSEYRERALKIREDILAFVNAHKKEFSDGARHREFTFGRVGLRKSSEIIARNQKAIIEALKQHGMNDCIRVTEKLDKEMLERYDEETLLIVGVKKKDKDTAFCDVDYEKIKE